jgi:hypothetical protein
MKDNLEIKFKLNNIESTLKFLLLANNIENYQRRWIAESYKNVIELKKEL